MSISEKTFQKLEQKKNLQEIFFYIVRSDYNSWIWNEKGELVKSPNYDHFQAQKERLINIGLKIVESEK